MTLETFQDVAWEARQRLVSKKGQALAAEVVLCHRCSKPAAQMYSPPRMRYKITKELWKLPAEEPKWIKMGLCNEGLAAKKRGHGKAPLDVGFTGHFQCPQPGEEAEDHRTNQALLLGRDRVSLDAFSKNNQFKIKNKFSMSQETRFW